MCHFLAIETGCLVCTEATLFAGRQQAALRKHLPSRRGRLAITTGEPDTAGEADSKILVSNIVCGRS